MIFTLLNKNIFCGPHWNGLVKMVLRRCHKYVFMQKYLSKALGPVVQN